MLRTRSSIPPRKPAETESSANGSDSLACLDNSKTIVLAILRKLRNVWFSTCISHYGCFILNNYSFIYTVKRERQAGVFKAVVEVS